MYKRQSPSHKGRALEGMTDSERLRQLGEKLDNATSRLGETRNFAKWTGAARLLDAARRLLATPDGVAVVYERVQELEQAGIFWGSDYAQPEILQAPISAKTLREGDQYATTLECLSQLRMLAVARGIYLHDSLSAEQAQHFLSQAVGLNLDLLFDQMNEADRLRPGNLGPVVHNVFRFLVEHVGYSEIFGKLIEEIWRILAQRPIVVTEVKDMVTQIAAWLVEGQGEGVDGASSLGADRLISALFRPTNASREDPGLDLYRERVAALDAKLLQQEARAFARAMHDTGLVSAYHAVFLRHVNETNPELLATTLGLSSTGIDGLNFYQTLFRSLIREAIHIETCQAIYGLAMLLERGIIHVPALAPALWRQMALPLCAEAEQTIAIRFGTGQPARVHLLAGVLSVLGQPLGIGQGNNPTCQAARATAMWSHIVPDYLMQLIRWAARDNEVVMHFEGQAISSSALGAGMANRPPADVDPVSSVLVPHLDRIYVEMGRLCADRPGDPHRWVNPELHGWWVGRGCRLAVDVATGKLSAYEDFLREFYAAYHPHNNGDQPLIHPQPAGLAMTDSAARFVGWHAIAIYRVAPDPEGQMRVYFYNPNNDSGQDLGDGVQVSTASKGEMFGESSLLFTQFASRLYLYHYDLLEEGDPASVPAEEIVEIERLARNSWAANR